MKSVLEPEQRPAWILAAGIALAFLGAAAGSQQDDDPPTAFQTFQSGYGTADSNGRMIAVTGVDVTGGSLLFVIDSETRHLSVYQATGGTSSTMNLKWVGGRNIDLDLQVDGFNDKSEISYKDLRQRFDDNLPADADAEADK